jgi:uncharacterized protein (DUF433 family)
MRGERAQILKWVMRELDGDFPGIDAQPDVCGGEPCIVRTRIPGQRTGIAGCLRAPRAEDLVNAWAYARAHPAEIEGRIRDVETAQ